MAGRQVAVITGASAGVGRATARVFAQSGFDVAVLARGAAGLEGTAEDVRGAGGRCLVIPTDVAEFGEVDAAASQVERELGPIDVWVNDAMTTVFAPAWEVEPAHFQRAVEVTFLGQVWGTLAALSRMRPRDRGSIVNVGSALAFIGIPLQAAYCSSKFACRGFFESARAELLHEGSHVRMSMVHLPAVNTPQFDWCETTLDRHPQPVPPIYQPEVPARYILEAALTGRPARVVGSWNKLLVVAGRLFPGLGNHYAALGAWDTQLTSEPVKAGRPVNLFEPADAERDHGAHGIFDDRAGGLFDPSFIKTLPTAARTFVKAVTRTAVEKRRVYTAMAAFQAEVEMGAAPAAVSEAAGNPAGVWPPARGPAAGARSGPLTGRRRGRSAQIPDMAGTGDSAGRNVQQWRKRLLQRPAPHDKPTPGDVVELFDLEDEILRNLFDAWDATEPPHTREAVPAAWDHGTVGKLFVDHGALYLAAEEEIARALDHGDADLAASLRAHADRGRGLLVRLDEQARGVPPVELVTPEFAETVSQFRCHVCGERGERPFAGPQLAAALGEHREELRSVAYVRKHAPTHPGRRRWFHRFSSAVRFQAGYDRLRDFPRADSGVSDRKLAEHYAGSR